MDYIHQFPMEFKNTEAWNCNATTSLNEGPRKTVSIR